AGAEVEWAGEIGRPPRLGTTDASGIATFDDLVPRGWAVQGVVTARGPGGVARATVRFEPPRGKPTRRATQLVLAAPGSLDVRVRAPAGESPRGTVVEAWSTVGSGWTSWTTGVSQGEPA